MTVLIAAPGTNTSSAFAHAPSLGAAQASAPPERISFLVTFGADKCPEAVGDEIVVCAAQPESERYRVPEPLRKTEDAPVRGGSWTSAVESLDGYARAVLPNSCSVNGSNGFTGCAQQALQAWSRNGAEEMKAVEPVLITEVIHTQSPKLRHVILLVKCRLTLLNK